MDALQHSAKQLLLLLGLVVLVIFMFLSLQGTRTGTSQQPVLVVVNMTNHTTLPLQGMWSLLSTTVEEHTVRDLEPPLHCAFPKNREAAWSSDNACFSDAELFESPIGPFHYTTANRSLMAMTVGTRTQEMVTEAVDVLGFDYFTWIFFVFEGAMLQWIDSQPWSGNVTVIYAKRQMKWWYVKRFLPPEMVGAYDTVWIWDDDMADLRAYNFDARAFVAIMKANDIAVAQPGVVQMGVDATTRVTYKQEGTQIGRYVRFVEVQFPVFTPRAYECMWNLLPRDSSSGYGVDVLLWDVCGWIGKFAVIDKYPVLHGVVSTSNYDGGGAWQELLLLVETAKKLLGRTATQYFHNNGGIRAEPFW